MEFRLSDIDGQNGLEYITEGYVLENEHTLTLFKVEILTSSAWLS